MTVDIGLSPASAFDVNLLGGVKLKKIGKNKMTVTRELSTVDDYAVNQKQKLHHHKQQQQSETAEEPKGNPDRAVMSSATSGPAASSAGSTTASSPSSQAASRPKFMITDILRNDSGPAVSVNSSVYNPSVAAAAQQQAQQPPPGLPSHHHPFYQFNLAAAAAAAAAYGFNPAGMMPGMMPPLHQFLVGHHQSQQQHHPHHHHPQMGPVGMMPSGLLMGGGPPNSAESSPRDLSFKRSAAAANFASDPNEDDEDEFVDPDGSDHDRDSPIGKADLMLSDDESDICKFGMNLKNIFSIDCDDRFSVSAPLFYSIAALCDDGNTMLMGFIPSMMSSLICFRNYLHSGEVD
jgi:hypothetical protein